MPKPGSVVHDGVVGMAHVVGEDGQDLWPGEVGVVYFEGEQLPFSYHHSQSS